MGSVAELHPNSSDVSFYHRFKSSNLQVSTREELVEWLKG
jgi:hypothetical protein